MKNNAFIKQENMEYNKRSKVKLGGYSFSLKGFESSLHELKEKIEQGEEGVYVSIVNVHLIALADSDSGLKSIVENSEYAFCDSVSISLIGKIFGKKIPRCHGPDFVEKCCEYGVKYNWKHFFVGGTEAVAKKLIWEIKRRFPGVQVKGFYCPPFRPLSSKEEKEMLEIINKAHPDFVWVGLGAGKQDKWINKYKGRIKATVFSGVGAAFDFISGNKKRAPGFIRKIGMEFAFRFCLEPKRLFFRNLGGGKALIGLFFREIFCHFSGEKDA